MIPDEINRFLSLFSPSDLSLDLQFAYPWLLTLPLLFFLKFLRRAHKPAGIPYGSVTFLKPVRVGWRSRIRSPALNILSFITVAALSVAAARPRIVNNFDLPTESRNLMLTLDLSGSMGTRDFLGPYGRLNRLEGVKTVVNEFIAQRRNDRIGLVVFGTNAYLQSPLTLDHRVIQDMVRRLQVGVAGEDTAIGDGLGLSLKRIEEIEGDAKAIILLTDGVNRAGEINPLKAASIAKDIGVKIHTIGIGSGAEEMENRFGLIVRTSRGEFDEETLKRIAEITGGVYFNASSLEGLKKVYDEIDRLEKTEEDDGSREIVYEFFPHFVLISTIFYLLGATLRRTYFLKIP